MLKAYISSDVLLKFWFQVVFFITKTQQRPIKVSRSCSTVWSM